MLKLLYRRPYVSLSGGVLTLGGVTYLWQSLNPSDTTVPNALSRRPPPPWTPPTRQDMMQVLRSTEQFDLLVVGGGATGAGAALDATTRGLKVALVEREDFSSGTSSKSTKLVHGGVRYLQKAVMELDLEQYKLVKEALHERKIFLKTAPYLSHSLPIMLPLYKYWQMPYYWAGCKMYDILAGGENMESSYIMSKGKALEAFPLLKAEGLVGAMVYYDGQHNDSRMNLALILTSVLYGATVANYTEVTALQKNGHGKISSATVRDSLTGDSFEIRAKGIVNATGPFSDTLLTLASDEPKEHKPIVQPSSGVHITLPNYYSPRSLGLIDPQTSDGRVIFFLPWQGNTIAGTTDTPASVEKNPIPREEDIQWILEEIRTYLSPDIKVRRGDVLSAWSGLRPLVRDPASSKTGTEGLVRNHLITVSDNGLLTVAGGKWTTYRAMAAEAVDRAIREFDLTSSLKGDGKCRTENVRLLGSPGWTPNMFISLIQRYGLDTEVARHLAMDYGDRAWTVCSYLRPARGPWPVHGIRISQQYPYVEAEIRYAVHHEYAQTAIDFLSRRSRLSFLNATAALEALPRVIEVMGEELNWSKRRRHQEYDRAIEQLKGMGIQGPQIEHSWRWKDWIFPPSETGTEKPYFLPPIPTRAVFSSGEVDALRGAFWSHVPTGGARIRSADINATMTEVKGFEAIKYKHIDYVMREAGLNHKDELDVNEFLEICELVKEIIQVPKPLNRRINARQIPVEKSGGGI